VLFSVWGLQDQFALWVESYGGAGLLFAFLRDGHGFAEHVGVLGPFAHKVIHFSLQEFFILGIEILQKAKGKLCAVHIFPGFQFQGGGDVLNIFGEAGMVEVDSYSHDDSGMGPRFGDAFT